MKTFFNRKLVISIAEEISHTHAQFDSDRFVEQASTGLNKLELKARSHHIAHALAELLPDNFEESTAILLSAMKRSSTTAEAEQSGGLEGMGGFRYLPFLDFVELYGLVHTRISLKTLERMTQFFSAEFAIRPFIIESPKLSMTFIVRWSKNKDWRVRRLASEGIRPRLPWAKQLPEFINDPTPVLPILQRLYADENLIVRRSVANNLNDIAKDHPDLAAHTATQWMKHKSVDAQWTAKHGLRTLIKQGHPKALAALGYKLDRQITISKFKLEPARLKIGERLHILLTVKSNEAKTVKLVVDFALERALANGKTARKVFKLKNLTITPCESVIVVKYLDFIQRSTRTYYPGPHAIDILVNGQVKLRKEFVVTS